MPRRKHPDGVLDLDRGSSDDPALKIAAFLAPSIAGERSELRESYQDMDTRIDATPGYTRAAKDADRATPRKTTAPLGHPRKARQLPRQGQVRVPLSSRQRKDRSKAKRSAQNNMPGTEYTAMREVMVDERWQALNDALSDAAGDAQEISEDDRRTAQRVDRAIQRYERLNDRSHVVYANAQMPTYINNSNIDGYARNRFPAGERVHFDRYTGGTQCLHEVELDERANNRTLVLEIATRRGMYMGGSDSVDNTTHLLPRGTDYVIVGTHRATYTRPDGSTGHRTVIQLADPAEPPGGAP